MPASISARADFAGLDVVHQRQHRGECAPRVRAACWRARAPAQARRRRQGAFRRDRETPSKAPRLRPTATACAAPARCALCGASGNGRSKMSRSRALYRFMRRVAFGRRLFPHARAARQLGRRQQDARHKPLLDKQPIAEPNCRHVRLRHQVHRDAPAGQHCEAVERAHAIDRLAVPKCLTSRTRCAAWRHRSCRARRQIARLPRQKFRRWANRRRAICKGPHTSARRTSLSALAAGAVPARARRARALIRARSPFAFLIAALRAASQASFVVLVFKTFAGGSLTQRGLALAHRPQRLLIRRRTCARPSPRRSRR